MAKKRKRLLRSIGNELIKKSRESALSAVQIFNNPQILFKSELFIVVMAISWTYLLHAYYRKIGVDYRYVKNDKKNKTFMKTKSGAYRHWDLEKCLSETKCPLDNNTINNLRFLIGLRHEIEHQMTTRIDQSLSAKFQACCLNYNRYIKTLFGPKNGIDKHLSFSLQFSALNTEQVDLLVEEKDLPTNISTYVKSFEEKLTDEEFGSQEFAYRVLFVPKTTNHKGQADKVVEFVKADSELASQVNKTYALIKETERPKYIPAQIVKTIQSEGYPKFRMHEHTQLWRAKDGKNPNKGFGVKVANSWYWYEAWLEEVRKHCSENRNQYS